MIACHHAEAVFTDPVFQRLNAAQTHATWRMLLARSNDLAVTLAFSFRDAKIIKHTDTFDLWRWTRHALGPMGVALGWSPMLQSRLRRDVRTSLETAMQSQKIAGQ